MITQTINLNLIPGRALPRINATQFDYGSRTLTFAIYNGDQRFTLASGMTAQIQGRKPDEHAFDYAASVSTANNVITANLTQQMTAAAGEVLCELVITKNSERIGTLNFIMDVQEAPINDDHVVSDSELPDIIAQATEQMERAEAAADTATTKASEASTSATNAASSATSAASSAASAGNSATSAANSATSAEASADRAQSYSVNTPYIGANGNWWVWNTSQGIFVDSGVDASITVAIADITMLEPDEAPYVTNSGTNTDPIFHLFIPRGKGISRITKTGTSGLVDTYTITFSDGATSTFTVTNGKTAYQSAVEGGYTGTEAEFEADLANFGQWKNDAETAAANAATSEANAARSASAASTSASNAATSETNAATSETNAAASETAASGSATAAANSATAAAGSASAAATSETNAANSATAAASSETNAAASETAASGSATAAANSATAAAGSASAAASSETNAAASETAASGSAGDAEAWAEGTRNGSPVPSTDPAYQHNAKYWADQAGGAMNDFQGATASTPGTHGLVPAPGAGDQDKVLKGDGTWGDAAAALVDLTDVNLTNPADGDVLVYDGTAHKWKNAGTLKQLKKAFDDLGLSVVDGEVCQTYITN